MVSTTAVAVAVVAALVPSGTPRASSSRPGVASISSSAYWDAKSKEPDGPTAKPLSIGGVYEGNTDQNFLNFTQQAAALPSTGGAWRNVGPFKGVVDIPGIGSGSEGFGPVGGIGTAIAVDPSDPSGNTVYLGTIGGLYKSTDGGHSVRNVVDGQLSRVTVGAIAVDPRDPKTVYVGTGLSIFTLSDDAAGTGVYVSHDSGRTWSRPAANVHGYGVNGIAVSPAGGIFVATNYGLWRSNDKGSSFSQVSLPDNATHNGPGPRNLGNWVTSVVVNPYNPQEVTAAVGFAFGKKKYADGEIIGQGNGLYRSTDGGRTFAYLPSTATMTWAGASGDPIGRTSLSYSTAPGGKGILWALVADAARSDGEHTCEQVPLVGSLCLDGKSALNGLYRSADDGATWQLASTSQTIAPAYSATTSTIGTALNYAAGVQADYNNWVVADPVDPNRVYIGLEEALTGEWHDAPLSMTWTAVEKYANACAFVTYYNTLPNSNGVACPSVLPGYGAPTTHPDQHAAAFARTPNGYRMYSGNDGGWWSQDFQNVTDTTGVGYLGFTTGTWRSLNSPATVLPWDVTRLQDGSYLLALQDNGVAHVRPDGTAYQVCGADGTYVFPGQNPHSYYCGIDGQRILATTDDFAHTNDITPSMNSANSGFLSPWTVDPGAPNHILAAAGNVDETTQGAQSVTYDPTYQTVTNSTWQTVFTPPNPPNVPWDSSAVYTKGAVSYVGFCSYCRPALGSVSAPAGANPSLVVPAIATNVAQGCKPATLSSKCWHMAAGHGLPHEQISGFAVDPANPRTIYVSLRQLVVLGADPKITGDQKVMVSHDGGDNFTDITGTMPRADAHRIVLRNGQLYVATDVGVFTANAGSKSWSRFGTGLPQVTYRSMKLDPTGRYLVAGAYGRGVWVYDFGGRSNAKVAIKAKKAAAHAHAK